MRTIYKLFLSTIMLMLIVTQIKAQRAGNENILSNGGFEAWEEGAPTNWRVDVFTFSAEKVTDVRPGSSGTSALKVHSTGGRIHLINRPAVTAGKEYTFTIWYKGSHANDEVNVTLLWRTADDDANGVWRMPAAKTVAGEWKKAEHTITIPEGTGLVGMSFMPGSKNGAHLIIDDISLVAKDGGGTPPGPGPTLDAPKNLKITAHQNEMEISWDKATSNELEWEITFDDKIETTTSRNTFIKTKLKPGSEHHIKIRAKKGNAFSRYTEQKGRTQNMNKTEDSAERVPFLRTLTMNGDCHGRFLKLYYNDLANPNAQISYKINGTAIEPKDDTLEFPDFEGGYKKFQLEIYINEGEGREWKIVYTQLGIDKN